MKVYKSRRMGYYSSFQEVNDQGIFLHHEKGYYFFKNESNEEIVFEEINKHILDKYDLKASEFNGKKFQIFYTEKMEDLDDEDFVVLRLDDLMLIE